MKALVYEEYAPDDDFKKVEDISKVYQEMKNELKVEEGKKYKL